MNKKKVIPTVAAFALAATMMTGGVMAYLTDTDTTTNVFTVGEVTIDSLEPNYPGNGSDETTDLVPNEEVKKDPQIKNTGKNSAVVYAQIDIPMANVITANDDGTRNAQANVEVFKYRTESGTYNSTNSGWVELNSVYLDADGNEGASKDTAAAMRRLYGYEKVLKEDETTPSVFDVVKLANVIEGQIDNSTQNLVVTSYAIQAENITDLTGAGFDETMDAALLKNIYQVYWNQSGEVAPGDADTSNNQTLVNSTLNVTMTVDDTHLEINTGKPADAKTIATVKVAYTGNGTAPKATLESSAPSVATVDANGNIQALSVGEAVITATATNPDNGKVATATVTIQVRDVNLD